MINRIYLGLKSDGVKCTREVFRSATEPTHATHGHLFNACVGHFRTMRGARFMAQFGQGNPHCRCVSDAERLGKKYATDVAKQNIFVR